MSGRAARRLLLAAILVPWVDAQAAEAVPPQTVRSCGVAFELPRTWKITRPRRTVDAQGLAVCAFDVVAAKPAPLQLDCKDEEDGGSPPYEVCDWAIDGGPEWPSVQVAQVDLAATHPSIEPFEFVDGAWRLPNPYADAEPLAASDFFGKPAWRGEALTRMSWYRTRVKSGQRMHAGTGSAEAVLLQLAPGLAVVLVDPPYDDDERRECRFFCASLRPDESGRSRPQTADRKEAAR